MNMIFAVYRCLTCSQERVYGNGDQPPEFDANGRGPLKPYEPLLLCSRCSSQHAAYTRHGFKEISWAWVGPKCILPPEKERHITIERRMLGLKELEESPCKKAIGLQ